MKKLAFLGMFSLAMAAWAAPSEAQERANRGGQGSQSTQQGSGTDGATTQGDRGNDRFQNNAGGGAQGGDRQGRPQGAQGAEGTRTPGVVGQSGTYQQGAQQGAHHGDMQHGQMSLQQVIVGKLLDGNRAEVELGQLAQQRSENQQVKQFAQQMVQEHTQFIEKLTALKTQGGSDALGQSSQGQQGRQGQQSSQSQLGGQAQQDDQQQRSGAQTGTRSGAQEDSQRQTAQQQGGTVQRQADQLAGGASQLMDSQQQVPAKLVSIMHQASQNNLQLTKDMLSQHKGHDFDMAYIGQQVVQHTHMLAELQALDGVGDQQLQQLIQQATETTQKHLDHAKQIAQELKQNQQQTRG